MKKVLLGICCFLLILQVLLTIFSISGRAVRQEELNNAFYSSMENAMLMLQVEDGGPQSEEEWKAMFVNSIAVQIESASDLQVHIIYADMEKGLLVAEAVLYFKHPNGAAGSVAVNNRILMEEYELSSDP